MTELANFEISKNMLTKIANIETPHLSFCSADLNLENLKFNIYLT